MYQRQFRMSGNRRTQPQATSIKQGLMIVGYIAVAGIAYLAGTLQPQLVSVLGRDSLDTSSLQETYASLQANYDGSLDESLLIEGANRGMVEALGDEYTVYLNKSETDEFNKSLSGDIGGGIGIEVGLRNDQPTVLRVLRDNPAEAAGVQVGDIIAKVNGDDTLSLSVSEVVTKIRGEVGTTVKLSLIRQATLTDISVTRAEVNNPSVYTSVVDGVGIMTISRFDSDTGSLAREAARELLSQNVRGIVLDLRGNGGGYVDAAKSVASLWLDNKLVVTEKSGDRVLDEITSAKGTAILSGVKTVVLINESSASASEIVAGALRDHGVAQLVGMKSFGKGSVQKLVNLTDGATLKVTIARWYTPNGVNISQTGITPDTEVSRSADDFNAGRDPQLERARSLLAN